MAIDSGFTSEAWPFSIATLNYPRVAINRVFAQHAMFDDRRVYMRITVIHRCIRLVKHGLYTDGRCTELYLGPVCDFETGGLNIGRSFDMKSKAELPNAV